MLDLLHLLTSLLKQPLLRLLLRGGNVRRGTLLLDPQSPLKAMRVGVGALQFLGRVSASAHEYDVVELVGDDVKRSGGYAT